MNNKGPTLFVEDSFELQYGYNYDYAMVFQVWDEATELTSEQREMSMRTIVTRLKTAGLETSMYYSIDRNQVLCKIRASVERLKQEASRVEYKLELDHLSLRQTAERGIPGHRIAPIIIQNIHGISTKNPYAFCFVKVTNDDR